MDKVSDIPCDYFEEMGVPITYLDKHNPEQFEIIGASRWLGKPMSQIAPKGSYISDGVRFYLPLDKDDSMSQNFDDRTTGRPDDRTTGRPDDRTTGATAASTTGLSSSGARYKRLYDRIIIKRKM